MSTELELAKGSPWVFTKTSNDMVGIVDTGEFFDITDTMDFRLPKKCLLMISYYLQIKISSPVEDNMFKAVFILCTLDPTSPDLLIGGVNCHPTGGVPFGNNFGLNTQRYHGAHSFTWVERVNAGPHKVVMRAMYDWSLVVGQQPPTVISGPQILARTLVVQAVPM